MTRDIKLISNETVDPSTVDIFYTQADINKLITQQLISWMSLETLTPPINTPILTDNGNGTWSSSTPTTDPLFLLVPDQIYLETANDQAFSNIINTEQIPISSGLTHTWNVPPGSYARIRHVVSLYRSGLSNVVTTS